MDCLHRPCVGFARRPASDFAPGNVACLPVPAGFAPGNVARGPESDAISNIAGCKVEETAGRTRQDVRRVLGEHAS